MLNALLLVVYLGISIVSLTMLDNPFAVGIAKWCAGVGVLLIAVVFLIPMSVKKRKFIDIVKIDFGKATQMVYLQMFKACIVAILLTQFLRIDLGEVNQRYYDSVDNMVMLSGDSSNEQLGEYLKAVSPFTPICLKEYITKRADQTIAYISTTTFIDSVIADDEDVDEEMVAMIEYARSQYFAAEKETEVAKNSTIAIAVYILIYFIVDIVRDRAIKKKEKKDKDDSEKKRDIFEGVNLMGD